MAVNMTHEKCLHCGYFGNPILIQGQVRCARCGKNLGEPQAIRDGDTWFFPKSAVDYFVKPRIFCETCGKDVDRTLHAHLIESSQMMEVVVECHGEQALIQKPMTEMKETLLVVFPRKRVEIKPEQLSEGNPKDLIIKDPEWDPTLVHIPCHCFQDETRVCPQGKTGPDRKCQIVVEELMLLDVIHELVRNRFKQTQETDHETDKK